MRPHIVSGLCAAGLTILVAAALYFASGPKIDPILSAPMMPGFFLAMLLGVRGGPDGMPSIVYVFGLSFLSWWIAIDLMWSIWRWVAVYRRTFIKSISATCPGTSDIDRSE